LRAKLIRAAAFFISRLCVFMVLICGANYLLFSPPSFKIDFVGLIYQTDFNARELFFEFDAEPSFYLFHPKRAQYLQAQRV
jgi:hypothetical protein